MRKLVFAAALLGGSLAVTTGQAQIQGFIGQMMTTGAGYCPQNWRAADGSLLPIVQYQALYSVIRNTYGGDGKTTFALPNLKGVKLGNQPFTWCIATNGYYPPPNK
jgi:tail collar domain